MNLSHYSDKAIGAIYLCASFSLAFFCLFQSHRVSHDQRARDIAGQTIHSGASAPKSNAPKFIPITKKIGEESD